MHDRHSPRATGLVLLVGVGVGALASMPLMSVAEVTIPANPFVADTMISADQMNDYINQLGLHLRAPMVQSDVTVGNAIDDEQIVAELAIADELETIGSPVRLDFVPMVGGLQASNVAATSSAPSCGVGLVIERQTEPANDWVPIAPPRSLVTTGTGQCTLEAPPASFSTLDVDAPAGTHRYRVRVVPLAGSTVFLESFKLVAYELRGVLPPA